MRTRNRALVLGLIVMTLCSAQALFAGGNKEVPDIPPVTSGVQYLSPNGDGVQDTAELEFTVKLYVKSDTGYVPEYGLQIVSESGTAVKQVVEREKSDIGWFIALFRGYSEFTLTKKIAWDGKDETGALVPDGAYRARIWVVDSSKNRREMELDDFIVDTTPPSAALLIPEQTVFSPDGDGNQDTLLFEQNGSVELLWEGIVTDSAGTAVRKVTYAEASPEPFIWDGTDDAGSPVSDGVYVYTLSGKDRAGNPFKGAGVPEIIVDTEERGFAIALSEKYFSPNGDDVQDFVTVRTSIPNNEVPSSWKLTVTAEDGTVVMKVTGEKALPDPVLFPGLSSEGTPLAEGPYTVAMEIRFRNGMIRTFEDETVLDLTPPTAALVFDYPVFSPNGDGVKDMVTGVFQAEEPVKYVCSISTESDPTPLVSSEGAIGEPPIIIGWKGTKGDGVPLPDGYYMVRARITDRAGNTVDSEPYPLLLDTKPVSAELQAAELFTPGRGDSAGVMDVAIEASEYERVAKWRFNFVNAEGFPVRTYSGTETLPAVLSWDGSGDTGRNDLFYVPDGTYKGQLSVEYQKGMSLEAESAPFVLDANAPEVELVLIPEPFVRDKGKVTGSVGLEIRAADAVGILRWTVTATAEDGTVLRSEEGAGNPSGIYAWEGIDAATTGEAPVTIAVAVFDQGPDNGETSGSFNTAPVAEVKNGRTLLLVDNIIFAAYKNTLDSAGADFAARNARALQRVAEIMAMYPTCALRLEAYALNIYGYDRKKYDAEEKILFPLTERRAQTVFEALVRLGVSRDALSTQAFGGKNPTASTTDRSVWWKNRRVEFVLIRE